jgi:hypothetical protein
VVVAITYLALAPTRIVDGEGAELSTLGVTGGIAHPPGFPLYVLWLRAWSWLPAASPAHAAAIATVILAVAHVIVLHAACRAWGARPNAATIAVAIVAGSPIVLRMDTVPEVFALNGLMMAAVLWLAAAEGPVRGPARVLLLGLVAGLGLSDHTGCVLTMPVGILGAIRGVRETRAGRRIAVAAGGVGALLVGLLPYLYLFVAPQTAMSWGAIHDVHDLIRHFVRADYGGLGAFAPRGVDVPITVSLGALAVTLGRATWWVGLAIGLVTLAYRCARGDHRAQWICLAVSFILAGPVLVAQFNLRPEGLDGAVVERFHLFSLELIVIPFAVGTGVVLARIAERTRLALRPALAHGLAVVAFVVAAASALPRLAVAHSDVPERTVRNILASAPEHAVVIGGSDFLFNGMGYLQEAVGLRRDVLYIDVNMMAYWWYQALIEQKLGFPVVPPGPEPGSVRMTRGLLEHGRTVLVDLDVGRILAAFPGYPYGLLIRVLPTGQKPPPLDEVVELNRALFEKFDLSYRRPAARDDWAGVMQQRYADTWRILARALEREGKTDDAAWAAELYAELVPR